ncbi:MAG: hypothetical protein A3F73_07820 [Gallionellales bacterium RIFCSPLOWO2_12_FULL_59_22]|nr:MAG: hypothetical protein A3F73_07820 [Gallionellales bacterium RIFCSPLOWO2_12_FULL_59_22]
MRSFIIRIFLLLGLLGTSHADAADWAANFGSAGANAENMATAVDASGNVYIAGYFSGATLTLGSVTLTKIGGLDAFVAKLDASGTVVWAKNYGGAGASARGNSIAVDASGNVYLGGYFQAANLTTPALTKIGSNDAFALKLDSAGNTAWAKNYGGAGASAPSYSIAVDASGNVYLGGYFHTANLTTPALTKIGVNDALIIKQLAAYVPDAPTIGTATAGNAQATVTFAAPGSTGGSAITGYTANCGGITNTGAASPITVTGLTNGTAYTCTVTATNAVGTGAASDASNSVTPATVPGAPAIGTATAGNAQATVAFTAPGTGGSAITGYTANCGGITNTGASSPITVTGLTNGAAYTCTVAATNAAGTGAASGASNSVTPLGSQAITFNPAPGVIVGGTGLVSATGGASGNAVTFTVPTTTGVCSVTGSTVTGLTAGTCTVAANQAGSANYAAAPQATQNITVGQAGQTITFDAAPGVIVGGTGTVSATGGASGNPVTFSSTTTGVCTVSGSTVTGVAAGTCTIAANQAGNANYAAAPQVTQSITVTLAPVNGACGTANGASTSAAPATGLCATGSASAVAGSGPWTWSCNGSNGGTNASCSAPVIPVVDAPTCTLTATPASITAGGTSVLTVNCSPAATSYAWSSNTGFSGSVTSGTVSPSATATYSVTGYNDGGAGNTASATVTVKHVVYPLAVTRSGTGTGAVTGNGIDCGDTCSASFNSGASVMLTASPATGSYFEGWSGECSGTGSCAVTMNAAKNVIATFKPVPFAASVTSSITPISATASATVNFKDDDKGKPGAVYVTAWVRFNGLAAMGISAASLGRGVHASSAANNPGYAGEADNRQAALYSLLAVADANNNDFVLIQLTPSGWQLVVDGQLTPYESGVLGDSLAYLSLLDNADTASLLGAQFCVGYGTTQADISGAAEMISVGRMQTVLAIPDPNSTGTANGGCNIAATIQGQAIEFYKADIDHYFMTSSSEEALFLNSKPDWNWVRTGRVFNARPPPQHQAMPLRSAVSSGCLTTARLAPTSTRWMRASASTSKTGSIGAGATKAMHSMPSNRPKVLARAALLRYTGYITTAWAERPIIAM